MERKVKRRLFALVFFSAMLGQDGFILVMLAVLLIRFLEMDPPAIPPRAAPGGAIAATSASQTRAG